jgi:molecular chaperone DnaJ
MDLSTNYYQILGLNNTSNSKEIKKSYYKLSFIHHPDRGGEQQLFVKINEAYNVLIDEKLREEYDKSSKFGSNYDESIEFLNYEFDNPATGWDEEKLKDFKKKERLNLVVRVDDTFDGVVDYERWVVCKTCKGSGKDLKSKIEIKDKDGKVIKMFDGSDGCDFCEGTGKDYNGEPCTFCFGQGKVGNKDCSTCNGEKRILGKQKLTGIIFPTDQKDLKVDFMGNFSKDTPGKVGHLWLVKST